MIGDMNNDDRLSQLDIPMTPCNHREFCGGCTFNGEDYESVLNIKESEVQALFKEKAGLILDCNDKNSENDNGSRLEFTYFKGEYQGIVGCPPEWRYRYRNKMEYTFGDLVKDGPLQLGMHKKGNFMSIITVDNCQLVPRDFNTILGFTLNFAATSGLNHYHKKTHKGVLRNLIIRKGIRTNEILVDIVTSSECDEFINSDVIANTNANEEDDVNINLIKRFDAKRFDAERWRDGLLLLNLDSKIVGIMHTINDNIADAVYCDQQRILFGRDYYYEEICDLRFKVNIFSFFQTNVNAVERLYEEAVSLLPALEGKIVYDLFCGTGTISQIVAKKARKVIGIEIVEDSVEAAKVNTTLNEIDNCEFICGDVFEVLNSASNTSKIEDNLPNPDVIIVDPPRVGLRTKAVNKIASYGVPEILYISCNPKTLAMDIADFRLMGYEPTYIKAYDNFCWTKHCEVVTLLKRIIHN